ncbi:MAG: hypothetical protein COX65_08455 [Elusimicrobia bacterium CG_4_10_14_0_2_um_filter_56_8]|nr:MAG: hypothetical protein COX65_08455 [Elusimicrobia bacterium CG_4_10_14_0_2_um_filter_56_8]
MKNLISALILCFAAQTAGALEITALSTAAAGGAVKGDFTFGAVTVKSISYENGGVVMPFTENKGKTYTDIKLLSKSLYAKIEACFKNGFKKGGKEPAAPAVKIKSFKPLKSKARVANAELSFDGELLVVAGVMASRKEEGTFWIAFPPDLVFRDKAFKSAVESAVIAAWAKKEKK